ncbi:MAG: ABC transporter substrate-binding protein [Pseudomonadales bacterium]|nr:ABC transporter substrate-binding protein [Pseudomonadales bacterium]
MSIRLALLALIFLNPGPLQAAADEAIAEARAVVQDLHTALEDMAQAAEPAIDLRYQELAPVIAASHDLPFIARFVLRRSWNSLAQDQQEAFLGLLERLTVMTYANRFTGLKPGAFQITGASGSAERVQVDAVLETETRRVDFVYTLTFSRDRWRIINVLADGVSDLALRRFEYSRIISEQGFDALLEHLREQTADQQQA